MSIKRNIVLYLWLILLSTSSAIFADWDCDGSLDPAQFATNAISVLEDTANLPSRVFFSDTQLQTVVKSLNTYCCSSGDISWDVCDQKLLYSVPVYESPNIIDHFKFIFDLQLQWRKLDENWNKVSCDAYNTSCEPKIYTDFNLPSPMVCFRNWADVENGGDERCNSVYDVWSGVDTLAASTSISSPAEYRWLYEKFWSSDEHMIPPRADQLTSSAVVQDLRYMQLWWLMCQEVAVIHNSILQSSASAWNILQLCKNYVKNGLKDHINYTQSLSLNAQEKQMANINTTIREYMYTTFDSLVNNIATLVSRWYQAISEMWTEYTTVCS